VSDAVVTRGRVGEFEAITLSNPQIRVVVIPALGGRVWELEDQLRGRQWIWHREGVPLQATSIGACYDDVWAGGWEELFPNDAPGPFEGRELPDHGEWWTRSWTVVESSNGAVATLRLETTCTVVRASCVKVFRLASDSATLNVEYCIRSHEADAFHFLFKQHLPIQLTPECRLRLPAGHAEAVDPSFGTMAGAKPFDWPFAVNDGTTTDMRLIPSPTLRMREFLYVSNLTGSWCGVEDTGRQASLRLDFDGRQLPFVWLFLTYGGWRDAYTAVLEPCTNKPKALSEAVPLGQSAVLKPSEEFRTSVSVTLGAAADLPR
jgi:hypothetical protein